MLLSLGITKIYVYEIRLKTSNWKLCLKFYWKKNSVKLIKRASYVIFNNKSWHDVHQKVDECFTYAFVDYINCV